MPTIDNKIVQMTFDNQQFERGVAESLKSLEALKKGLELDKAVDSLSNLEKTANSFDISGIAKGVEQVADKFTFLGRVAQNVYDDIYRAGKQAISGMINTITEMPRVGEQKYETKNKAVQMIKAALPEKSLEDVENVLARLNEYTDLTSYDFATMAKSIGKFTAAGIDLDVAERAMEGIANQTASAGGEISTANIAMYNFSQALSAGAVKMMDWRSIENQNLATKEFKEQIIQTAIELGKLSKVQDNVGRTAKGTEVSYLSFRETLAQGWFDNDVLIGVLEKYADRESEVGERAFKAAREAITFQQAVDAVKDALSTGWMNSWQLLIGNLDEATEFLTTASDAVIDFFDIFSSFRNEILEGWHYGFEGYLDGISGYTLAVETLGYVFDILTGFAENAARAIGEVFGVLDENGQNNYSLSRILIDATKSVHDSVESVWKVFGERNDEIDEAEESAESAAKATRAWSSDLAKGVKGSKSEVKTMQELFMRLNSDTDTFGDKFKDVVLTNFGADGIFGKETEAAVKAFQQAMGTEVTGVFDSKTQELLDSLLPPILDANPIKTWSDELKKGTTSEEVRSMQSLFMELNKDTDRFGDRFQNVVLDKFGADGIFGKETEAAVKAFQAEMGLAVTGVFDTETQEALHRLLYPENKNEETVFERAEEAIYKIAPGLEKFRKIVTAVFSVIKLGTSVVKTAIGVVKSVVTALAPVGYGLFSIIAGVADIVTVVLDFISVFDMAGNALSVFDFILTPVSNALAIFGAFLTSIGEGLSTIAGLVRQGLGLDEIREELEKNPDANGGALMIYNLFVRLQGIIETITPYVETAKAVLVSLFATAYSWISGKLKSAFNNVKSIIDAFKKGGFENAFGRVIRLLSKSKIGSKFVGPLLKLKSGIKKIVEGVSGFGAAVIDIFTKLRKGMSLEEIFNDLMRNPEKNRTAIGIINFLTRLSNAFNTIKNTAKDFKNALAPALESVWTKVKDFGTNIWNGLVDFFTPEEGKTFFESIGDKISGWAESAWANIVEFFVPGEDGKGLLDHINEGIATISTALEAKKTELETWWGTFSQNPIVTTVTGFLSSIWSGVIDWLVPGREGSEMGQYVDDNVENIKGTFENSHSGIGGWWSGLISNPVITKIVDWAESAWANAVEWFLPGKDGRSVIDHIQWGILIMKYRFIALKYKIKSIWNELKQNPVIGAIVDWTESAWANVVEFFTAGDDGKGLVENIQEAFKKIKRRINLKIWSIRRWWDHDVMKTPIIAAIADWTKSAWANVVGFFTPTIEDTDVGTYIARRVEEIRSAISEAWNNVTTWFETVRAENPVINTVATGIETAWNKIVEILTMAWEKVNQLVTISPETGKTPIQEFLDNAGSIFDPIANLFTGFADELTGGWNTIKDAFKEVSGEFGIVGWISDIIGGLGNDLGDINLKDLLSQVNGLMTGGLIAFGLTKIAGLFGGWTNLFQNFIHSATGGKFNFFQGTGGIIGQAIQRVGFGVLMIGASVALIVDAIKRLQDMVNETSSEKIQETLHFLGEIIGDIIGFFTVKGMFGLFSNMLSNGSFNYSNNSGFNISGPLNVAAAVWLIVDAARRLYDYTKDFDDAKWEQLDKGFDRLRGLVAMFAIVEEGSSILSDFSGAGFTKLFGGTFTRDQWGGLSSGGGAVGLALAVDMLVGTIQKLAELDYSTPNLDWGKVTMAIEQIKGLIIVLGGTEAAIGAFTRNAWGQISSGGGAVGLAIAIEIIIDAVGRLAALNNASPNGFDDVWGVLGQIGSLIAVMQGFEALTGFATQTGFGAIGILFAGLSTLFTGWSIRGIIVSVSSALTEIQKSGIDTAHIDSFASFLNVLVGIIEAGNNISSIIAAFNPLSFLGSLGNAGATWLGGEAIASLARGLSDALVAIKDVPVESIDKFSNFLTELYTLLNGKSMESGWSGLGLIEAAGSAGVETAVQAFTHFTNAIFLAGSDIASFERDTRDISDWSIFETAATKMSGMVNIISGITKAEDAATILGTIGGALALYGLNIAGITIDEAGNVDTKTLEDVFTALAGVFESDSATAAIAAIAPGDGSAVTDFSVGVVNLSAALDSYAKNIGGLDENKVATANGLLKTIAGLELPKENTWWGFITGKQSLSTFAGNLTNVGEGVAGFATALEGFHPDDGVVTAALDVIGTLVGYAANLDSLGSYSNFDTLRSSFIGFFSGLENTLADPYGGNWDSASLLAYSEAAVSLLTAIANGLSQNIGILQTAVGNVLTTMETDFNAKQDWWYKIGKNIDAGMADGIYKGSADPVIAALAVSKAIWSVVSAFFGIASPSKEFAWVGQMVDAGLAQGLTQYSNVVESASEDVAQATLDGYDAGILSTISDTPVIRPVLDLSDVTSGAATIGGMFGNYGVGVTSSGIATRIASEGSLSIGGSGAQDLVGAVSDLNDRVDQLTYAISNMKVVTETGALVGAISTQMDIQLGENEFYDSRGI